MLCAYSAEPGDSEDISIECETGECSGAYMAHHVTLSGNCGSLEDAVVMIDGLDDFGGCTVASATWSGDGCQVEATLECPRTDGGTVEIVGVAEQRDDACDQVITTATYRLRDTAGMLLCSGTYRITYERL